MPSLLVHVKAKLAIHAHQKVRGLLEGEYGSVFKGRSMDFDDLREYVPGDDVKDIDWKATARSGSTLIRRYVAVRKHNILLAVDTGRNMAATSTDGEDKREVAILTAGAICSIALKHGDLIGLVAGDSQHTSYLPFKGSSAHAERLLQTIYERTSLMAAPGGLRAQLEYIAKHLRRKMFLVVISDDGPLSEEHQQLLRRLRAQHELLWIQIGDTSGLDLHQAFYDIEGQTALPDFVRSQPGLQQAFAQAEQSALQQQAKALERIGIASQRITGQTTVVGGLFKLLERHRYAGRR